MKIKLIMLVMMSIITQLTIAQSPWTREKGKAFVQLGFTGLFYDKYKRDGKEIKDDHKFSDITIQAYTEYGITNNLEALLIIPYKSVGYESKESNHKESLTALGNVTAGLKYKLFDEKWKISIGLNYEINTNKIDIEKNLTTGFNANTLTGYLSAGSSSGKWYYFANLGLAYMNNDYNNYFKGTAEVGYEVISRGHLIFVFDSRNILRKEGAFNNPKEIQWPSYQDRQTYNALGIKGNYEFSKDKYGVNFAVFSATGIDNAPLSPTINFGFYAKL